MIGSAGRLAALLLLMLALVVLVPGCAAQSNPGTLPAADAQATMRIRIVRHGWHSGIVVRAADAPQPTSRYSAPMNSRRAGQACSGTSAARTTMPLCQP